MIQILCPDEIHRSVLEIDLDVLTAKGIRGIIVDLDNTLVAWELDLVSDEMKGWVDQAQARGFKMCIASNGIRSRVRDIAHILGLPYIPKATKPRKRPFRRALQILGLRPESTAVVGDQIFTDILGGNRLDLYTILINPVSPRELRTTRLVRRVERRVISRLYKKGYVTEQQVATRGHRRKQRF